ncbi:hypothetical protein KIL84_018037 [Mauremys mutica]|uniref:Uncharacterized protein n=1 Tax=Mauremys mutica TaxID=74926 RepID=A0A9D3XTX2_9SAUR|nr:hypothetical protein KIL84_018037 [Mauremys mutica]
MGDTQKSGQDHLLTGWGSEEDISVRTSLAKSSPIIPSGWPGICLLQNDLQRLSLHWEGSREFAQLPGDRQALQPSWSGPDLPFYVQPICMSMMMQGNHNADLTG